MNIEKIILENIKTEKPQLISKNSYEYITIPLIYDEKPLKLKFNARMKIFHHDLNNSYSLGITIPENLLETFESFEEYLNDIAVANKREIKALNSNFGNFQKGDFRLIKNDQSGNPKIYAKLYADKVIPLQSSASFYRVVEEDGKKKKQKIKNNLELVGVPLDGICVINLKQIFCGSVKALTCTVQEVLIEKEVHPQSAFDDYEDEE